MDILIRQTSGVDNIDAVFTDRALDLKSLHIGSAPDQELQLVGERDFAASCGAYN